MHTFHSCAPVPVQWVYGKLPRSAVQLDVEPSMGMHTGIEAAFPSNTEVATRMFIALKKAFPEILATSLVAWLAVLTGIGERIRAHCKHGNGGLQALEFYCGSGAISRACKQKGLRVKAFDLAFSTEPIWEPT